ncbi:unnamed protein product, partial [Ostreobium quekettii]
FFQPNTDVNQGGTNDIVSFAGEQVDGKTSLLFRRKVDTGDQFDRVIKDKNQDVVFAYGSTDSLPPGGHGPCCRGKGKVNLMSRGAGGGGGEPPEMDKEHSETGTPAKPNRRLILAHAWIQTVSWAVLAVMGLVMSRLARHWKYWRHLHVGFEVSATALSFLGEMVAFGYSQ